MFSAALVAALVGYGASIALVLSAAAAVGASPAQTASWLVAVCFAKAIGTALLSSWHRMPMVLAWSTPGAAVIAATSGITFPEAVGAFVVTGILLALTGALRPLGQVIARIPEGIAGGMLAGVLLPFCLKGALAAQDLPGIVLPMVAVFALVRPWNPALAVLAAFGLGLALAFGAGAAPPPGLSLALPVPVLVTPQFRLPVLIGLALPLYLVTMASQNLPGFATMRAAGYEPPVASALMVTGGLSTISAIFGAHPINMAAITAAICLGDDVHPDRTQRWKVGLAYGAVWMGLGLAGPFVLEVLAVLPRDVMAALVALALVGPLIGALTVAYGAPPQRFAATITLVVTASGVVALGIGAAFWGLVAGLVVFGLDRLQR